MKKRILAMLLTLVLLLGLLAACGKDEQKQTDTAGDKISITFVHSMNEAMTQVLDTYIAKFHETYPEIEVTAVSSDGITEDTRPDVLYCYPEKVAALVEQGAVVALDSQIESKALMLRADGTGEIVGLSSEQKQDICEIYYNEGSQFGDGAMYMLPLSRHSQAIYYNQTFFEENGLDAPLSWEVIGQLCERIKALDPECIPLCIDDESDFFISLCAQYGGDYTGTEDDRYLFNNETNHAFVKTLNEWYQKGYLTTKTLSGREAAGSMVAEDGPGYYMVVGSTADAASQRPGEENEAFAFELGILPFPQVSNETPKVVVRGPGLCIYKADDDMILTASWIFVKYLTTNVAFQADFAMAAGHSPVRMAAELEEDYSDYLDNANGGDNVTALAALSNMEQQSAFFADNAFVGADNAREQVGQLLNKCLQLTGDDLDAQIEAAFAEAVEACKKG